MSQQTNQNFLLKQQISQLKKQANKRYNSQQRPQQQSSNAQQQQNSYSNNYGGKNQNPKQISSNTGTAPGPNVYLQNQGLNGSDIQTGTQNQFDKKRATSNIRIQSNNQMNLKPQNAHGQTPVMRNNSNNLIQGGNTNFKVMNSSDFAGGQLNMNNQEMIVGQPAQNNAMNQGNSHNRNNNSNQSNQRRKSKSTQPGAKIAASQRVASEDLRGPVNSTGLNNNNSALRNSEYLRNMAYGGKNGNGDSHASKLASKSSGNLKQFKQSAQQQQTRNQAPQPADTKSPLVLNAQLQNSDKPPPRAQSNLQQYDMSQANSSHGQQFFSQRLSNSNTNLKHIIKVYKDEKGSAQGQSPAAKGLANNPAAAAVVMQAHNRQPSAGKKGIPRAQSRETGAFSRESAANFSDYRQVAVGTNHGSQVNLYPNSPPNVVTQAQVNHAPSNSYGHGPVTHGAMGVKKRLDSSSRIAPDVLNQNKNIISPSHSHQRQTSTNPTTNCAKNMHTAGSQYTTCQCPCVCNKQTNQTSHMASIFSNSQGPAPGHALTHGKNNTIQLVRSGVGNGLSSLIHNATIYGEENFVENGEIEELHYLMVRVEKMKKAMLGRVECSQMQTAPTLQNDKTSKKDNQSPIKKSNQQQSEDDQHREELLYRSTDYQAERSTMMAGQQSVHHASIKGEEINSIKIVNDDLNFESGKKNIIEATGTNLILIDYD